MALGLLVVLSVCLSVCLLSVYPFACLPCVAGGLVGDGSVILFYLLRRKKGRPGGKWGKVWSGQVRVWY